MWRCTTSPVWRARLSRGLSMVLTVKSGCGLSQSLEKRSAVTRRQDLSQGLGETDIVESVTVNADEYRKAVLQKNRVLDAIRKNMWWFRTASGKPEAGQVIYYQHDGARPHTSKANEGHWARHGRKAGINTQVVTQPAQSPDLSCNDLAFFTSLQVDTELVVKKNVKDLIVAVEENWNNFPAVRTESVWRILYASYKRIIYTDGDNSYSHHTGSRTDHASSQRKGELHDRQFPLAAVRRAEAKCIYFVRAPKRVELGVVSTNSSNDGDD